MLSPLAWYLTLAGIVLLGTCFVRVAAQAPLAGPAPTAGTARIRALGAWTLGVAALPITLFSLAYAPLRTEAPAQAGARTIDVVGHQWYWELSETQVPVGETVVFRVTSADVNHGFAVYDSELRLIAQTQAMPHYSNELRVRFETPGSYKILCLEYCGLVHHGMSAQLEAVDSVAGVAERVEPSASLREIGGEIGPESRAESRGESSGQGEARHGDALGANAKEGA